MAKKVKLSESQLRQMVREAVSGLDPRTLANYARKRELQGQKEKAQIGRDNAVDTWNARYGKKYDENTYSNGELTARHSGNLEMAPTKTNNYSIDSYDNRWDQNNPNVRHAHMGIQSFSPEYGNEKYTYNGLTGDGNTVKYDKDHNYHDEGLNVANQMANGNGKYEKGKGWTMSESQLHNIVKTCVNCILNEGNVIGSDFFPEGTDPNTKEGYLRLLVGKFVIEDGMDAASALHKATEIVDQKY